MCEYKIHFCPHPIITSVIGIITNTATRTIGSENMESNPKLVAHAVYQLTVQHAQHKMVNWFGSYFQFLIISV